MKARFPTADIRGRAERDPCSEALLSRFEAHFHFRFHIDGVAAPDGGLITKIRPRHSLTELRAGFEFRNFPFLVDDEFATSRPPRGLPEGRG